MPSKSKAQFGEMGRLFNQGKITRAQLEDFNKGVDYKSLPEHVGKRHNPLEGTRKRRKKWLVENVGHFSPGDKELLALSLVGRKVMLNVTIKIMWSNIGKDIFADVTVWP
jgi:hypothetical protein